MYSLSAGRYNLKVWDTRAGTEQRERLGHYWIENTLLHTIAAFGLTTKEDAHNALNLLKRSIRLA